MHFYSCMSYIFKFSGRSGRSVSLYGITHSPPHSHTHSSFVSVICEIAQKMLAGNTAVYLLSVFLRGGVACFFFFSSKVPPPPKKNIFMLPLGGIYHQGQAYAL